MNTLLSSGRYIYASGMLFLGLLCFYFHDFIIGRPPGWNDGAPANALLTFPAGGVLIICALAVAIKKQGTIASLIIASLILFLSVAKHLINFADWLNALKAMALFGGTLVVMAAFSKEDESRLALWFNPRRRHNLVTAGSLLIALFFIASGYAHFLYAEFVEQFIPAYIPLRKFWTYFCGVCLFAGGVGIIIPPTRYLASFLSGIMVLGWFFLLHIPRIMSNMNDPSDQLGLFESFTFSGVFFILCRLSAVDQVSPQLTRP